MPPTLTKELSFLVNRAQFLPLTTSTLNKNGIVNPHKLKNLHENTYQWSEMLCYTL